MEKDIAFPSFSVYSSNKIIMPMRLIVFGVLSVLISCQGNTVERAQTVKNKDKEKISVITLPQSPSAEGYEWLLEPDDSVCYMPDYFPVFSCGNLNHYVQNKIKDVHLATGYVTVSFVVSETGSVGQVTIVKSAGEGAQKERVADAKTAERMDSIAYEVVKNLPDFTPAKWKGKNIAFRLYVKLRFQE